MRKRTVSIILAAVMVLSTAAGCGNHHSVNHAGTDNAAAQGGTAASETEKAAGDTEEAEDNMFADKKVGVCIYQFHDSFMTLFRGELESYLINRGFAKENISIVDGENSQEIQTEQMDKFIAEGVDVLIMNPVNPSFAGIITDKAVAAGIPLVYINREPDEAEKQRWVDNDWNVTYVGCDNRQSGIYQGEMIADLGLEAIDRNGNGMVDYVMVEGDQDSNATYHRTQCSIQALIDAGYEVNCLENQPGNWQQDEARQIVAGALEQYGDDVEVVFCNNDAMALGALQAIEAAGRTAGTDIYVVGVDALSEALENVIEGTMVGTVLNDHFSQSHSVADAVINYLTGAGNEHNISCDYVKVTKDNAQDLLDMVK